MRDRLKVVYNVSILRGPRTGIGNYTWELLEALKALGGVEPLYFDGVSLRSDLHTIQSASHTRKADLVKSFVPGAYRIRRALMQRQFSTICSSERPDLYHEPSLWPLEFSGSGVMTLHDLTHVHFPETQPRQRILEINRRCQAGLAAAGAVLVDSEFIAREVADYYQVSRSKIIVAPLGVAERFRPRTEAEIGSQLANLGLAYRGYILSVGTLEPRKNLTYTLEAHRLLPKEVRCEFPLVVVGMHGWHKGSYSDELQLGLAEGSVKLLGYLNDDSLAAVVAGAKLSVYPSLYEGFGLPVLEAMASATPVMVSDRASLPEVAGSAGCYVPLDDANAYAEKIRELLENNGLCENYQQLGLNQAAQFSWRCCAEQTLSAYHLAIQ